MDEAERKRAAVRYDCMQWAMQIAASGDDALGIVARAELFAEFVLAQRIAPAHDAPGLEIVANGEDL